MSGTENEVDPSLLGANKPKHIAIIMDGNGRWALQKSWVRTLGHREGVKAVKRIVRACDDRGIEVLTLFAFSSENWRRPRKEVGILMELLATTVGRELNEMHRKNIRIRFLGDLTELPASLQKTLSTAEEKTQNNTGLVLAIAINYGGRWDITQATRKVAEKIKQGELLPEQVTEEVIQEHVALADLPEPDLFIRTGGEQRISNFLLWQLAYCELYFTETLWPDFNEKELDKAIESFSSRQRRFGLTGIQVEQLTGA